MNTQEVMNILKYNTGVFPRLAIKVAITKKEEMTPLLMEVLEEAKRKPEQTLDDRYMAHIYAMYLLAQFREKRAYPLIVEFFSIPGDFSLDCTGGVVTEDLHRILASVSQGDTGLIRSLIENEDVNEYVRSAALKALLTLVARGEITREEVMEYHKSLFRGVLKRKPANIWNSLVSCCTNLYTEGVIRDIRQAFKEDLVEEFFISYKHVLNMYALGKERVLEELQQSSDHRFIEDTVREMEWWDCFQHPIKGQPKLNNKVGRNEPCPCGSGKKYKKCCGRND